jgi:ribonuclease R
MIGRLQVRFMADKTGQTFEGIVSGVSAFGLFVELLDHFVSGAVEIAALQSDYFRFDEKNYRLIGSRSGKTFQLGDLITVRVANVDLRQHRINFVLA